MLCWPFGFVFRLRLRLRLLLLLLLPLRHVSSWLRRLACRPGQLVLVCLVREIEPGVRHVKECKLDLGIGSPTRDSDALLGL